MAKRSAKFELTAEQEATLKMWVGSHRTQQRYSRRAQVILLSAQGLTLEEIGAQSGLNRTNCLKWRKRFASEGLDGLRDKPRKGRPAIITDWKRAQAIRLACERPFNGANAWSRRELARVTGLGSTTVHRILADASLKPHKVHHWCGKSPDPESEPKQTAILGLYLSPPENALVLSVDEKSQIQALDRTQPELPLRPGNPKRHTATYTRHGTTCLLAALAVHEGTVEARCVDSNNRHTFLAFLKSLYRAHPHKHLHVIVDNLPLHKAPGRGGMGGPKKKADASFYSHIRLVAQPDRDLVSHLFSRCGQRRGLEFKAGTGRSNHALHQTIQPGQSPSVHLDLYGQGASVLSRNYLGT